MIIKIQLKDECDLGIIQVRSWGRLFQTGGTTHMTHVEPHVGMPFCIGFCILHLKAKGPSTESKGRLA